ncbi:MAG: hypothetical protein V4736_04055 [Bdellovibrionota bacterium]
MFEIELYSVWKNTEKEEDLKSWLATKLLESISAPTSETDALFAFLIKHKFSLLIIEHVISLLKNSSKKIPWPYFFEALKISKMEMNADSINHLKNTLLDVNNRGYASLSSAMDISINEMTAWRKQHRLQTLRLLENEKAEQFDELRVLRAQQLFEREREQLKLLQKKYPDDPEVKKETRKYQERYAEEIILKRPTRKLTQRRVTVESEVMQNWSVWANLWLKETPALAPDIIAGFLAMDFPSIALEVWQNTGRPVTWLGAQVLLENGRFIDVLEMIPHLESKGSSDPETFFASSYLRAQALWGAGQKDKAIEIMEALLNSSPEYRSAREILQTWRTGG